jgi:hypothetical protein
MSTISFKLDGVPYSFSGVLTNGNSWNGCESHINPQDPLLRIITAQSVGNSIGIVLRDGEANILPQTAVYKPKSRVQILVSSNVYTVVNGIDNMLVSYTNNAGVISGTFSGTVTKGFPTTDANYNITSQDRAIITDGIITDVKAFDTTVIGGGIGHTEVIGELHTNLSTDVITTNVNYISNTIRVYKNNVRLGFADFTQTSANEITLIKSPNIEDEFIVDYISVGASTNVIGEYHELLASSIITTAVAYKTGTIGLYKNGARLQENQYSETGGNQITLLVAPTLEDTYIIDYHIN